MNSNLQLLSSSLDKTIKESDLTEANIDLSEVLIDSFLEDGIAKDIPILGTIIKLSKFSINLKDHLFLKKIVYFLSNLKDVPVEKRNRMILKIDDSKTNRIKVGEKLIYIIDKCEDHIIVEYISKFFKAFLLEKITYSEFLRCSSIVQNIFIEDFEYFINCENLHKYLSGGDYFSDTEVNIINSGLCHKEIGTVGMRYQSNSEEDIDKYIAEGVKESMYLTEIGKKIKDILK